MVEKRNALTILSLLTLTVLACSIIGCKIPRLNRVSIFEGHGITEAAAAFQKKLGSFKALSVQINHDSVTLKAQDPNKPANVDEYRYSSALGSISGPHPVELDSLENNLDQTLFDFASVNWDAAESLTRTAIERIQIDGGKIEKMTLERNLTLGSSVAKTGSVTWTIEVNNSREHATVYADDQGKIKRLDLSHTARAAKFDILTPESLREAVSLIDSEFGPHAQVMDIDMWGKNLRFKAPDPKTKEINQYSYDINGISEDVIMDASSATGQDVRKIQRGHKLEEILFDIDSIGIEQAPEFGRKAIQRLGFENAGISSIHVKREELINSTKLITFWEVICKAGRKYGTVYYDLNGKELGTNIE
jgi:hypothetical protein